MSKDLTDTQKAVKVAIEDMSPLLIIFILTMVDYLILHQLISIRYLPFGDKAMVSTIQIFSFYTFTVIKSIIMYSIALYVGINYLPLNN